MSVQNIIHFSGSRVIFKETAGKKTPFRRKMYRIKTMLLNTKTFCEQLKPFLLRIRANVYGIPTRNKQVTHFDSKLAFFLKKKKKTPLLMLTNQNKALFIILTNPNKVLCIKIKQSSGNSRESVCQGQAQYLQ